MKFRRTARVGTKIALVLSVAALAVTACSASDEGSSTGGGSVERPADPGATLKVAWTLAPENLDPHQSSNYQVDFPYLSPTYDRLTQAVAGPAIEPMLAESWTYSSDGLSADFVLRTDATFHDGTAVDAHAVVESLNRARDSNQRSSSALTMISDVQSLSDDKVRITTSRPAADLPSLLSSTNAAIVNPKVMSGQIDISTQDAGSGPYGFDQVRLGDRIVYKRFDGYWDKDAQKSATLEVVGIGDSNARLNAFRSGQVDVILAKAGQTRDLEALAKQPQFKMKAYTPAQFYAVQLDIGQSGLEDPRVRQALNYAIDRDGINAALLSDVCAPTSQPLQEGFAGYDPSLDNLYSYEPAKASALLKEAGVPTDLRLKIMVTAGLSPQTEMATVIQAQLAEVGVAVDILPMSNKEIQQQFGQGGFALLNPRLAFPTSGETLYTNYLVPMRFPTAPSQNFTDAAISALDPNINDDERTMLYGSASRIAAENAYDLFICAVPTQVAYTDKIVGTDKLGQADFTGILDVRYLGKTS